MTKTVLHARPAAHDEETCCSKLRTVALEDPSLPDWLADAHIKSGYRTPARCGRACLSCFSFHNETVNIYTHGIGAVFFVVVGIALLFGAGWNHRQPLLTVPYLAVPSDFFDHGQYVSSLLHQVQVGIDRVEKMGVASIEAIDAWFHPTAARSPATVCEFRGIHACYLPGSRGGLVMSNGRHTGWVLRGLAARPGSSLLSRGDLTSRMLGSTAEKLHLVLHELEHLSGLATTQSDTWPSVLGSLTHRVKESAQQHLRSLTLTVGTMLQQYRENQTFLHLDASGSWASMVDSVERLEEHFEQELDALIQGAAKTLGVEQQRLKLLQSAGTAAESLREAGSRANRVPAARWPVLVFVLSAITCLACSVAFHLFWIVDQSTFIFLAKLDYAGIAVLIAGSTCPMLTYAMWCDSVPLILTSALMYGACSAAIVMGLMDRFSTEEWRAWRAGVFIACGCVGVFPMAYILYSFGHDPIIRQAFLQVAVMGAMYIGGALLYVTRIPERFWPGRLDLVGASHQIFHLLVFLAAFLHYHTVLLFYRWREMQPECPATH
jgi:channel protein (hemolysin III family)